MKEATLKNRVFNSVETVWTKELSIGRRCHLGFWSLKKGNQQPDSKLQRTGWLLLGANVAGGFNLKPVHLYCSVTQSCPTLRPHELLHARPPCPSPSPGVCPSSCDCIGDAVQPRITALSWQRGLFNLVKLWTMQYRATQDGWVILESSDKTWSAGGGNSKPPQYTWCENLMPWELYKRQKVLIYHFKIRKNYGFYWVMLDLKSGW